MQKNLNNFLETEKNPQSIKKNIINDPLDLSNFEENEWTFKVANTKEFTHFIFNEYPARMIPQVARKLIKLYYPFDKDYKERKPLLDPFAGSGTSCLEAILRGIDSIAFDLNPLAHLIEKVKTSIVDPKYIEKKYQDLKKIIRVNHENKFKEWIPDDKQLEFWYSLDTISKLSVIRYSIETLFPSQIIEKDKNMANQKDFFLICFGKTVRDCSYQRKGENKTYRMQKDKIEDFNKKVDVFNTFSEIVDKFSQAKMELYNFYYGNKYHALCNTVLGNSMELEGIRENSIDLIVTSPPYGDSHTTVAYGQFSRFPMEWILMDLKKVKEVDNKLLGGIEKEQEIPDSLILLDICKHILTQEIIQQLELISLFQEKISIDSEFVDYIKKITEFVKKIKNINDLIPDVSNFEDLLILKSKYFHLLKEIRPIGNKGNKLLLKRNILEKNSKFRIIEDRLGYVLSFFSDYMKVFKKMYQVLDYNRKCCIVIGNRTVKNIQISTDEIIIELGKNIGFRHLTTYFRQIPNKKMPLWNSPSNISGITAPLMDKESIIILEKPFFKSTINSI